MIKLIKITATCFISISIVIYLLTGESADKEPARDFRSLMREKYQSPRPMQLSPWLKKIKKSIKTNQKIIALTLDACGGKKGSGYDKKLIEYLIKTKTPATLFISGRWIHIRKHEMNYLSKQKIFDIENHGLNHLPATVCGMCKYNICGPKSIDAFIDEILINSEKIKKYTNKMPVFYRPGTACFCETAASITTELGIIPLGYSINGFDFSRKTTPKTIATRIIKEAKNGSIILLHMNHPEGNTYKALRYAIPHLKKNGCRFVKLSGYKNNLI